MTGTVTRSCANCKQMYLDHRYFRTICGVLVLLSPLVAVLTLLWVVVSPFLLLIGMTTLRQRWTCKQMAWIVIYPIVVFMLLSGCMQDDPLEDQVRVVDIDSLPTA